MKIKIAKKDETKNVGSLSFATDDETNGEEMSFSSINLYDIGSHVKVSDGGKVRFLGVIVSMEENTRPPHTYKALDFSYNLKGEDIIQFKKMPAAGAISELLGRSGISSSVDCTIPTKITKICKGTIIDILKDILKTASKDQGKDYYFEVDGEYVRVKEKAKTKVKPTLMIADDTAISRSIEDLKNEVYVVKGNKVLASASDSSSIKKLGTLRYIDENDKITKAKAQGEASTQLAKLNRSKSSKQLTLLVTKGYWDIRKNRLIYLNGGGLKGWYRIKSATHTIEGSTHKVEIEVGWNAKI